MKEIYNRLEKEHDYTIYEKISVLMSFTELFNKQKSCEHFLQYNFYYLKNSKIIIYPIISLAAKFINDFINNLDEESPSYFKLIELNSNYGYYPNSKIFSYDIISLSDFLKQVLLQPK